MFFQNFLPLSILLLSLSRSYSTAIFFNLLSGQHSSNLQIKKDELYIQNEFTVKPRNPAKTNTERFNQTNFDSSKINALNHNRNRFRRQTTSFDELQYNLSGCLSSFDAFNNKILCYKDYSIVKFAAKSLKNMKLSGCDHKELNG